MSAPGAVRVDVRAAWDATVAAVSTVADQLPDGRPSEHPTDRVEVRGGAHVAAASRCPAMLALDGDDGFVPGAAVAGPGATATVVDLLVHGHLDPGRGGAPTTPAAGFRTAWDARGRTEEWPWPWVRDDATREDRAVLAAGVARRTAALARLLDPWPPPDASHVGWRPRWAFPGRPLTLHGRVDIVLGRSGHGHRIVVVLGGDHGPATRARLCYEALVATLHLRAAPGQVLGLLPDAGRRWPVTVDDGVLAEGVEAAGAAARAALGVRRASAAGLPRRPGAWCRGCAHTAGCDPGRTWLAGPANRIAGFLPAHP
jgi:hypothetical protein